MKGTRICIWLLAVVSSFFPVADSVFAPSGVIGEVAWSSSPRVVEDAPGSWALERINEQAARQRSLIGQGVTVAVIDTGIDFSSIRGARAWTARGEIPDNRVDDDGNGYIDDLHGWNFDAGVPVGSSSGNLHWHGTFVAGLIGDERFGVAPGVTLMDLRVTDARGRIWSWSAVEEAIRYAVDNGAQVINLSLIFNSPPPKGVVESLDYAQEHGVVVIGSAGNSGRDVMFPARLRNVCAVSATADGDVIAPFSSHGVAVSLSAPGADVPSLLPDGRCATSSGTSFAAAYVSGAVAVLVSSRHGSPSAQLHILEESAVDIGAFGRDPLYGWGRIDLARAVALADPTSM